MKINFKNGKYLSLSLVILIYILAILVLPSMSILNNSNNIINNIVIYGFIGTVILLFYNKFFTINNIENNKIEKYSLSKCVFYSFLGFIVLFILQALIVFILKYLNFDVLSKNTLGIAKIIKNNKIFIIYVVLLAPIMEEIVFREAIFGYFYDILFGSNSILRFILPAILTGFIFGVLHDGLSILMIIYILMSCIFSYLYLKTKRIITPIIAHSFMNFLVVLTHLIK